MSVDNLRKYLVSTSSTREKVNLRQFAKTHLEKTGRQPELLCDFFPVIKWICSASDYHLIETGSLSPYSLLYGNHSLSYEGKLLGFVETIRSLGLEPVFFVECSPLSDLNNSIQYELYRTDWMKDLDNCANILQVCAGHCELSKVRWSLKEGTIRHMLSRLESPCGAKVIYCAGKVAAEAIPYMKTNKNACGILTLDTSYAIVPSCGLFLLDLFPPNPNEDLICEIVWSSWLASSLDLDEHQLIDLAILCGNTFTSTLNQRLQPWEALGIVRPDTKSVAKWISEQSTALLTNTELKEFLTQNPCYEAAIKLSYQFYLEENQEPASHSEFNFYRLLTGGEEPSGVMVAILKHGVYVRPVLLEPETIKQPQFCDATLSIRKLIYALTGLPQVTEVGLMTSSTAAVVSERNPSKISVNLPYTRDNSIDPSAVSNLSQSARLAALFYGVSSPPDMSHDHEQVREFMRWCVQEGQALGDADVSSVATILLSSLKFMKSCNSRLSPSPDIFVCELEALLATSLFLVAGFPPWDFPVLPSPKAVTIASRFSHLLDHAYWLASCLGLSHALPVQGELFSSYAYIPVHHICYLFEQNSDIPPEYGASSDALKHLLSLYKELWELDAVLQLRAVILTESKSSFAQVTQHYSAAVQAIVSSEVFVEAKGLVTKKGCNGGRKNNLSPITRQNSAAESLLDADKDAALGSSDSMSSLERSELSYTLECHAMEEDHYYSSQPILSAVNGGEEEYCVFYDHHKDRNNASGGTLDEDAEQDDDHRGNSDDEEEEMLLKVTVDSILSESKQDDPPVLIDSEGRKMVSVDSVLVNTSDSSDTVAKKKKKHGRHLPDVQTKLPILEHREKILELVRDHSVICIEGETGCGKSTKVPQFILDEALHQKEPQYCNIIVTQPRRVAAVKLAERVAAERRERVGKTVGYCVGGSVHRAPETKLTYCTVGYLLQILIHNPSAIQWYTHIILDEVHERSTDTDFAMLVIRRLISAGQSTKIILMSATMQGDMLTKYFEESFHFSLVSSPYFVGSMRYPVKQYFLDELGKLAESCTDWDKAQGKSCNYLRNLSLSLPSPSLQQSMFKHPSVTELNMDMCTHSIISQSRLGESILVFLPGIATISFYYDQFSQHISDNGLEERFRMFILHSQVPFEDQKEAFQDPASDMVHVILATNIAESSLTLPKLRMVINFGIYHHLQYDPKRRTSCLRRRWSSRASCAQRAGRAGRVFDGIVVHLFTKRFHDTVLSSFDPPEILTAPLAKLVLQVKMISKKLGESSPCRFLSDAIEYPPMEQLRVALRDLAELGAIASSCTDDGDVIDEEADITLLGYFCLALPIDLSLCRLVLYSILFGIPFEGIVIAASLSLYQDVFSMPSKEILSPEVFLQRLKSTTTCRVKFDGGHYSHAVQVCTLFKDWIEFRNANLCSITRHSKFSMIRAFCLNVGVRWERLFQLESAVADIAGKVIAYIPEDHAVHSELLNLTRLTEHRKDLSILAGLKKKTFHYSEIYVHYCEDVILIKALVVASFSNQLLIGKRAVDCAATNHGKQAQSALSVMTHCGMDPLQTLVMHNLRNPSLPSLQFLALSVLPDRHCNVMVQNNMGFVSLVPKFESNPKTVLMVQQAAMRGERVVDPDTQNSSWNPFMMESSVVEGKLSPDIVYLWQYGENKPVWKVPGLQDSFTRASHPFLVRWERLTRVGERAYNINWRRPIKTLVDLGHEDDQVTFLAVAATLQGTSHDKVVSVNDLTVLPNFDKGCCSSLLLTLAFQPPSASVKFLINKENKIIGMDIEKHHVFFQSSQYLTFDDIVRINALRKALSDMLSSYTEDSVVFQMEKVCRVHSLLDCMLRRRPVDLVSQLPSRSRHLVWEMVDFGKNALYEELVSESDSEGDCDGGVAPPTQKSDQDSVSFYPPMKLSMLSKVEVREIASSDLLKNRLFQCDSAFLPLSKSRREDKDGMDFKLSPLAKSFVPQNRSRNRTSDAEEKSRILRRTPGVSQNINDASQVKRCVSQANGDGSTSVLPAVSQPDESQLKLFQPQPTSVSGILTSSSSPVIYQNSFDISHLRSFFPSCFPGFGPVHALTRSHLNPSVVLQASSSSGQVVNAAGSSNVMEFQVPKISAWRGIESIAQIKQANLNQCLMLFGQMWMSRLRLRPIQCSDLLPDVQELNSEDLPCITLPGPSEGSNITDPQEIAPVCITGTEGRGALVRYPQVKCDRETGVSANVLSESAPVGPEYPKSGSPTDDFMRSIEASLLAQLSPDDSEVHPTKRAQAPALQGVATEPFDTVHASSLPNFQVVQPWAQTGELHHSSARHVQNYSFQQPSHLISGGSNQVDSAIQNANHRPPCPRPQPCYRYSPPVYIPPPAFSLVQFLPQNRMPVAVRGPGRSKQKKKGRQRDPPPPRLLPTHYRSRYHHPPWCTNMLCPPCKVHPSHVYQVQGPSDNSTKKKKEQNDRDLFPADDPKVFRGPNYIPPAGSIWNNECTGSYVVHRTFSKKEREMPPHQVYGINDNMVVQFYCDYLRVVGGSSLMDMLCGPVYRSWLLQTFSVSLGIQDRLPSIFFEKYPTSFSVLNNQDECKVKLTYLQPEMVELEKTDVAVVVPNAEDSVAELPNGGTYPFGEFHLRGKCSESDLSGMLKEEVDGHSDDVNAGEVSLVKVFEDGPSSAMSSNAEAAETVDVIEGASIMPSRPEDQFRSPESIAAEDGVTATSEDIGVSSVAGSCECVESGVDSSIQCHAHVEMLPPPPGFAPLLSSPVQSKPLDALHSTEAVSSMDLDVEGEGEVCSPSLHASCSGFPANTNMQATLSSGEAQEGVDGDILEESMTRSDPNLSDTSTTNTNNPGEHCSTEEFGGASLQLFGEADPMSSITRSETGNNISRSDSASTTNNLTSSPELACNNPFKARDGARSCKVAECAHSLSAHPLLPPPPGLQVIPKIASESVLSNLRKALYQFGITRDEDFTSVMETLVKVKEKTPPELSSSPECSVSKNISVNQTESVSSWDSLQSDQVVETEAVQYHFPSALLSPGNGNKSLEASCEPYQSTPTEGGDSKRFILSVQSKSSISVGVKEHASSVSIESPSSSVVQTTLSHHCQEGGGEVGYRERTKLYLLSIFNSNGTSPAAVDSSRDVKHAERDAVYCSNLEAISTEQKTEDDVSLYSRGHEELSIGLHSEKDSALDASLRSDKNEDKGLSPSFEKLEDSLYSERHEDLDVGMSSKGCGNSDPSLQSEENLDFSIHPKSHDELEIWLPSDVMRKMFAVDNCTDSHSWPDLMKGDKSIDLVHKFSEKMAYKEREGSVTSVHSLPVILTHDKELQDKFDVHQDVVSAPQSDKSPDSWPGIGQDILSGNEELADGVLPSLHTVDLCQVGDVKASAVGGQSPEEGWSSSHDNCLPPADSGDWVEVSEEQLLSQFNRDDDPVVSRSSSKTNIGRSTSNSSLPDRELYVPPQMKSSDSLDYNTSEFFECTEEFLKDGPVSFNALILSYRKKYPHYPYLSKDYFLNRSKHFCCTIGKKNVMFVGLNLPSKSSSSAFLKKTSGSIDWQQEGEASSTTTSSTTDQQPALKVSSSFIKDMEVVVKEICRILTRRKGGMRCSQISGRLNRSPRERLDRAFFERHGSLFEVGEIRHKREGDGDDFLVYLINSDKAGGTGQRQEEGLVEQSGARSRSRSRGEQRGRRVSKQRQVQVCRDERGTVGQASREDVRNDGSRTSLTETTQGEGMQGASRRGDDRRKKKKKARSERQPERMEQRGGHRRPGGKGRSGHKGEPLYVYGSGLPFYCSKAESESEL